MTPRHIQAKNLHAQVGATAEFYERDRAHGDSREWHTAVGRLVHACCAAHADLRHLPAHEVAASVIEWVNENARQTQSLGNLMKARAAIASNANVYLTQYAPDADAQFLGAEVPVEGGRIDLAWFVPDLGIVVDELKTVRQVHLHADNPGVSQCHRYVDAGVKEWGDLFAGVRYLPLAHPKQALFIDATGAERALAASPAAAVVRKQAA